LLNLKFMVEFYIVLKGTIYHQYCSTCDIEWPYVSSLERKYYGLQLKTFNAIILNTSQSRVKTISKAILVGLK